MNFSEFSVPQVELQAIFLEIPKNTVPHLPTSQPNRRCMVQEMSAREGEQQQQGVHLRHRTKLAPLNRKFTRPTETAGKVWRKKLL